MHQAKKLLAGRVSLVACVPVEWDRLWPRPPARWPAREGAAGMRTGGEGGGRNSDWQHG